MAAQDGTNVSEGLPVDHLRVVDTFEVIDVGRDRDDLTFVDLEAVVGVLYR